MLAPGFRPSSRFPSARSWKPGTSRTGPSSGFTAPCRDPKNAHRAHATAPSSIDGWQRTLQSFCSVQSSLICFVRFRPVAGSETSARNDSERFAEQRRAIEIECSYPVHTLASSHAAPPLMRAGPVPIASDRDRCASKPVLLGVARSEQRCSASRGSRARPSELRSSQRRRYPDERTRNCSGAVLLR